MNVYSLHNNRPKCTFILNARKKDPYTPLVWESQLKDPTLNFTQTKDGCDENTMKWYLRLGHCNLQPLKLMKTKKMGNGINDFISTLPFCQSCLYGKQQ
jgi:hypothetical protein